MSLGLALALVLAPVQVGLERVAADGGRPLRGKRVGLLAGGASVTLDGRPAVDVLRQAGVDVRRLFAAEHGLWGASAAGEHVADGRDPSSGLPIVSLYGEKRAPEAADFAGLDALVFDLQDAGVRFYTYNGLLLRCLDAVAQAGLELVVLDRPNPLGGELLEGPEADPASPRTLLNQTPGPLVHGLTSGELMRYVNGRRSQPVRLTVVPMQGWKRSMRWADTGRPWVPPSPNLRTAEAALVYPGVALLEATNVSEGRGSDDPFLLFGAPWLRAGELSAALSVDGLSMSTERFVPRSSPAAPDPKHRDVSCAGLRLHVTDADRFRPYAFGLALLAALRQRQPEFGWLDGGRSLDALLGTRRVREALEKPDGAPAILATEAAAIATFRRERQAALLY